MTTGQLTHEAERQLARRLFNRAWELIDCQDRTADQDRMMLVTACAAFWHWDAIGTEENRAIADWQIAHVASLLGYGKLALSHATSALSRVRAAGLPAWLQASALEGLARAHAAAGNQAERDFYLKQAIEAVAVVADAEERELISAQIATVPRAATELSVRARGDVIISPYRVRGVRVPENGSFGPRSLPRLLFSDQRFRYLAMARSRGSGPGALAWRRRVAGSRQCR